MTDLPPGAIACALDLVGAVRDRDPHRTAHTLRHAARTDGWEALAVSLAAMVDDTRTVRELLDWCSDTVDRADVQAWRRSLTDRECRDYHAAYERGERDPEVVDGHREFDRRRCARKRRKSARALRVAA